MKSLPDAHKELMQGRDWWTDEMRESHARRKTAVDACMSALADLDSDERRSAKDRLRDLFDLEEGLLDPSDVSP